VSASFGGASAAVPISSSMSSNGILSSVFGYKNRSSQAKRSGPLHITNSSRNYDIKIDGETPETQDNFIENKFKSAGVNAPTGKPLGDMQRVKDSRLITAIKTPYTYTGRIDLNAYDKLCEFQIANGAQGIVVGGTTGEGHLMNWEEHLTLIEHSCEKFGDKLSIIGNTGSNSTREALIATKEGFRAGMHGAL
jgi:hypothetical protein